MNMAARLSPPQRPLPCCFNRKGFLAVGLGRGKKGQRTGNAARPPKPNIIQMKKIPIGSLCGGERPLVVSLVEFWWQRCSSPITPQEPFKQDLDSLCQVFFLSEVVESTSTQVAETPCAKTNPFCSDSGFTKPTTPLAMSTCQAKVTVQLPNPFRRKETVSNVENFENFRPKNQKTSETNRKLRWEATFQRILVTFRTLLGYKWSSLRGRRLCFWQKVFVAKAESCWVVQLTVRWNCGKIATTLQCHWKISRTTSGYTIQSPAVWRRNSSYWSDIRSMVDLVCQASGSRYSRNFYPLQHFTDALSDKDDRLYLPREKPSTLTWWRPFPLKRTRIPQTIR